MFRRIVFTAFLSGLVAGLLITAVQQFTVIPMILEAEAYETAAPSEQVAEKAAGGHVHVEEAAAEEAWAPQDGTERTLYTAFTNVLGAIGFALLLGACYSLLDKINWRKGLMWGLGGFAAFQLAPAFGLPPELPGTVAAELSMRQLWWLATAIATAGGLALIVYAPAKMTKIIGALIIVLPHAIGAPTPFVHATIVPDALATSFIIKTLLVGGVFWLVLGGLSGYTFNKFKS